MYPGSSGELVEEGADVRRGHASDHSAAGGGVDSVGWECEGVETGGCRFVVVDGGGGGECDVALDEGLVEGAAEAALGVGREGGEQFVEFEAEGVSDLAH